MAWTLDGADLVSQLWSGTAGLAVAMRSNANVHLAWLSVANQPGQQTTAQIAAAMNACAASYLSILSRLETAISDPTLGPQIAAALTAFGKTVAEIQSDASGLNMVATTLQNADKSTVVAMQTTANAVLSSVVAPTMSPAPSIWG